MTAAARPWASPDAPWSGPIPAGWRTVPLFTRCVENDSPNVGNAETSVLSLSYGRIVRRDVESNYGLLPESFETYTRVEPGDVVLRLTDLQNDKTSLRVGLVTERGIVTSAYVTLRPHIQSVLPRWLYYLLHAYDVRKVFYSLGGGVRQSARFEDLKRLPLLMPPLAQQNAIADYLDRKTAAIDALIETKEKLLEHVRERHHTIISHAITKGTGSAAKMKDSGIEWFGEVPVHWDLCALRYVVSKFVDYRGRTPETSPEGIPLVTASAVRHGTIDRERKPAFVSPEVYKTWMVRGFPKKGDVVFTTEGATFGETAQIAEENIALAQRLILLKAGRRVTNDFLFYFFISRAGRGEQWSNVTGTTVYGVSSDALKSTRILVPPVEEQVQIVEHIRRTTSSSRKVETTTLVQLQRLAEYRQAVINAAVTGQLDVAAQPQEAA